MSARYVLKGKHDEIQFQANNTDLRSLEVLLFPSSGGVSSFKIDSNKVKDLAEWLLSHCLD